MLNLIPQKSKKDLRFEKTYLLIKKICLIICITLSGISALFVGSYWLLQQTLVKTQEDILVSAVNYSGAENLKIDIINFNRNLTTAKQIQQAHINPLLIIENLISLIPADVKLTNIYLDFNEASVELQGKTKDRDALLSLQDNLQQNDKFTEFDYPIGGLTEKEDIDFLFSGKIDIEKNKIIQENEESES